MTDEILYKSMQDSLNQTIMYLNQAFEVLEMQAKAVAGLENTINQLVDKVKLLEEKLK